MEELNNKEVCMLGGGSWATALVKILLNNIPKLNWYIRSKEQIEYQKKYLHNPKYISSVELSSEKITYFNDIQSAIDASQIIIVAIPSPFLKDSLKDITIADNKFLVSAVKGIIPEDNVTIAEFLNEKYNVPFDRIGIISGPCHAEEVALERLSYLTVACKQMETASQLAELLQTHYIKVNAVKDIYGIEYASVLKNIIAIGAGICHGLGYGDNFQAVLISNAIQEIKRFLEKTYKSKRKVFTSPYLGDLLVTSYSQFSRNRFFGTMIGKGYSIKAAQMEMNMIAEGFYALKCIHEINKKFQVNMPITDAVYNIIYEKISPVIEICLLADKLK